MADIRDKIIKEAKSFDKFLDGLKYPIEKGEIYKEAQARGYDENLLSQIDSIPDGEYNDPTELSEAIGEVEVI